MNLRPSLDTVAKRKILTYLLGDRIPFAKALPRRFTD
jgi:hypothetical protein